VSNKIRAYAKVNLHLEVLNRRDDGYHNIVSLMANVELHDLLKLESFDLYDSRKGEVHVTIVSTGGTHKGLVGSIPAGDNLITRAASAYLGKKNMCGNIVFSIEKNIPAGAGLAGGSSDAAAALKLLNGKLSGLTEEEMTLIGSGIGADVPYCLQGGFALCRCTGEIVVPVPGKFPYWVLIANDGIHVDTALAYKSLKRNTEIDQPREAAVGKRIREIVNAVSRGSAETLRQVAVNDFECPVFKQHPKIGKLKERLYTLGADFSTMSGSGSSVIGIFKKKDRAVRAQTKLEGECREVIFTKFVQTRLNQVKSDFIFKTV
jgi:4-diphosphocytidyl-2-C-methyl-D-erythritol kinase